MSVYMPKINYILLIYRNLFPSPTYTSKLLLLNSLIEFLGAKTDIHLIFYSLICVLQKKLLFFIHFHNQCCGRSMGNKIRQYCSQVLFPFLTIHTYGNDNRKFRGYIHGFKIFSDSIPNNSYGSDMRQLKSISFRRQNPIILSILWLNTSNRCNRHNRK